MPKFSREELACLKDTMLQRLPESCFTREDVKSIQDETRLDAGQIRAWSEKFRSKVPVDERETYLTERDACPITMPQLSREQTACIKDTMLQRLPRSCFTHEDVKYIQDETGLDVVHIRAWAENFRYMVPGDEREAYLKGGRACPIIMPQLSREQKACLKDTMLQRLPQSCFTYEDVKSIQDKTGLDVVHIRAWAEKFRCKVPGDKRVTYLTGGRVLTTTQEESTLTVKVNMLACVYCTSSPAFPGLVKIGRTINLRDRLSNGNIFAAPAPFMPNYAVPTFNAVRDERNTHEFFKQYHKVGKFFEVSPQSVDEYFTSHIVPRYEQDLEKVEDREKALEMSNRLLKSPQLPKKQQKQRFNPAICESPCSDKKEWVYGTCSPAFPGKIKIGRTADLIHRLSEANVFCAPAPHVYVAAVPTFNSVRDEAIVHEHFDEFRREGEFFEISVKSLRKYFRSRIVPRYKLTRNGRLDPGQIKAAIERDRAECEAIENAITKRARH